MNRKQRIIVSVTGIFLVLLILVGLTYAYFLTKIKGNDNEKSISVTTADLKLTYSDNSAEILGENLVLVPSDTEIGTKTFTVKNEGNAKTSYVVVIEDVSITKDGATSTFESNDFRYTLTCTKKDGTNCDGVSSQSIFPINGGVLVTNNIDVSDTQTYTLKMWYIDTGIDQSNDMGKTLQAKVNITNIESLNTYSTNTNSLAYNIIENARTKANGTELLTVTKTKAAVATSSFIYEKGTDPTTFGDSTHTGVADYYVSYADDYTVDEKTGRFTLINPTIATSKYSADMANSLVGKYAMISINEQHTLTSTQNVGEIYKISTNISVVNSDFKFAKIDYTSLKYISTEKELSVTTDDYGTSYYYRGGVTDNYVNFAGMCWKIVRIQGDGSVKLILEDYNTTCNSGSYTGNWNDGNTYAFGTDFLDGQLADAFKDFQTTKMSNYLDKLKVDDWCYDNKGVSTDSDGNKYYGAYKRIYTDKSPSLVCSGTKLNAFKDGTSMYVGTLTADEIVFAGATNEYNSSCYLTNNYTKNNAESLLALLSLSRAGVNTVFIFDDSKLYEIPDFVDVYRSSRPSINLKEGIEIASGNGTKTNPYVVS